MESNGASSNAFPEPYKADVYDGSNDGGNDGGNSNNIDQVASAERSERLLTYAGACVAGSFILMCRASSYMSKGIYPSSKGEIQYAVAVGVIGLFLAGGLLMMAKKGGDINGVEKALSAFNCLWWLGASWLTFTAAFSGCIGTIVYISIWASVLGACLHAISVVPIAAAENAKSTYESMHSSAKLMGALTLAATVEWIAASIQCGENSDCSGTAGYAVALGVISMCFSLAMMLVAPLRPFVKFIALFLAIWWTIGAMIITGVFDSDHATFANFGNGFIATYGAMIAACMLAATLMMGGSSEALSSSDPDANAV